MPSTSRKKTARRTKTARLDAHARRTVSGGRVLGSSRAAAALKLARRATRPRRAAADKGLLIAEGDSWFQYPFFDVLKKLKKKGYRVETAAHWGDNVEDMAFDPAQTQGLAERFEDVRRRGLVPKAILLSGGGNDIAGEEFSVLLNHKLSGLHPLNARVVDGVLADRVLHAYAALIAFVTRLSRDCFGQVVRVVIHGYGNAVPDGRGYLGGAWKLPGPWLEPGFRRKGYGDLQERVAVTEDLIGRFNRLLAAIPSQPGFGHVRYRDVRPLLPNDRSYKTWWDNELHPTSRGFEWVATALDAAITGP